MQAVIRIRQGRRVSRVGDVSDTDTPGIRSGYVSVVCPCIPGYVGRKLTNGDVSAQSIRPSPTIHRSFLSLVTYSRVPTPPTWHSPPHAAASASDSPTRRPDPPPAGEQPPPLPATRRAATSLRPCRRRGAPAAPTKGCTRPPATSPGRLSARGVELWKTRMPDVLARDNGVASTAAAGWLGARQQHLLCRPGSLPAPFPSFPLPFLSNFYQSLFPRRQ